MNEQRNIEQLNKQSNKRINEWQKGMSEWMTEQWTNALTDEWTDRQTGRRTSEQVNINKRKNKQMDGQRDKQLKGSTDKSIKGMNDKGSHKNEWEVQRKKKTKKEITARNKSLMIKPKNKWMNEWTNDQLHKNK